MYTNSAYWHQTRLDFKDKKHPIFIGSCGTYRLYTIKKLPTHRPRGRLDYQLLYVASGKAHFYFDGKEEIVSAGNMVLYRPKEEQRYYYYGADHPEVYWVHFTGNNVKNILRKYGIVDGVHVIYSGVSMEYKHLYMNMIEELQLRKDDYEELLVYYFMQLLILLHRQILVKPHKKNPMIMDDMALIISECITINRLILKNMQLRKILVLAGLSRTSNNIRIQHPPSTYRTCVFQMRNLCWKPQTTMLQKFPIWLDMKIHYISAASSGNSLALRRHSFGNNCGKMKRIR